MTPRPPGSRPFGGSNAYHTTDQEIAFVNSIGAFSVGHDMGRRELLASYIEASKKRVRWGTINPAAVLNRAAELLNAGRQ